MFYFVNGTAVIRFIIMSEKNGRKDKFLIRRQQYDSKQFVKAIPKDENCSKYFCKKFPDLSKAKLKEGNFVRLLIHKLIRLQSLRLALQQKKKKLGLPSKMLLINF